MFSITLATTIHTSWRTLHNSKLPTGTKGKIAVPYVSNHRLEWLVSDLLSACVTDKILSVSHIYQYHLFGSMATLRNITVHMPLTSPTAHSLGERETFLALGIIQHRSNNTLISYKGAAQCLLRFYRYLTAESPTIHIQLPVAYGKGKCRSLSSRY